MARHVSLAQSRRGGSATPNRRWRPNPASLFPITGHCACDKSRTRAQGRAIALVWWGLTGTCWTLYDTPQSRGPFTVYIRLSTVEYTLLASTIPSGHVSPCKGLRARLRYPITHSPRSFNSFLQCKYLRDDGNFLGYLCPCPTHAHPEPVLRFLG